MSEYEKEVFPLTKVFDYKDWRREYEKYWNHKEEKTRFFNRFEEEVLESFDDYQLPEIRLLKGTTKEAVCIVFEKSIQEEFL